MVMGTMPLAVEYALGIVCLITGCSLLLQRAAWREWMASLAAGGPRKALTVGMLELSFFALALGGHWIWSGPGLFVTILCVLGMMEGALYLLKPYFFPSLLTSLLTREQGIMKYSGVLAIALGIIILIIWYDRLSFGEVL